MWLQDLLRSEFWEEREREEQVASPYQVIKVSLDKSRNRVLALKDRSRTKVKRPKSTKRQGGGEGGASKCMEVKCLAVRIKNFHDGADN